MMNFSTLEWIGGVGGKLRLIDQRVLPGTFEHIDCVDTEQLFDAIKTLAVRGAPAIGVSAAYGICLGMQAVGGDATVADAMERLKGQVDYLGSSRPTAVNLFWALNRMREFAESFVASKADAGVEQLNESLLGEAHAICAEDQAMCRKIGENGEGVIPAGGTVLTHCNAGALATAGMGTALSPMYVAHERGKSFSVFVDETRPLLQGGRLTAWELTRAGIDATLICDNMAGMLMKQGKVDAVITGADRIAANGDAANKIGTFSLSVLASHHNIPFYIAAPSSTFDLEFADGSLIPIEERDASEVTSFGERRTAPADMKVYNPAFDVADACNITAIITERGIIERPDTEKIAEHLKG